VIVQKKIFFMITKSIFFFTLKLSLFLQVFLLFEMNNPYQSG
jgi:hypothetical protein